MGGSVSIGKNAAKKESAAKAPSGSAAKYEDKGTGEASSGSKNTEVNNNDNETKHTGPSHESMPATAVASDAADEKGKSTQTSEEKQTTSRSESNDDVQPIPGRETSGLERNDFSASQITLFQVGDFVKVLLPNGQSPEGLVMEITDSEKVIIDFCSEGVVKEVYAADCELIVKSDTMEVGDQVQVQPKGSAIFFVGRVGQINSDGTYDVVMEGDDPDDIEYGVQPIHIRKLMSRRAIVIARWKRAALVVSSINNFQSFVVDPSQFSASARANKEASVKAANDALYANRTPTAKAPTDTE